MKPLLLDDFTASDSKLGTRWEGFTDRVMGGVSDMSVGVGESGDRPFLYMTGNVSLRNNGGFIQARLPLGKERERAFDASAYAGFRLVVRGTGNDYYLFLRTTANLFPWAFYMAPIPVTEDWQEVFVPFSAFKKGDFGSLAGLNLKKLENVAVVAYKKEFAARLELREIGLY